MSIRIVRSVPFPHMTCRRSADGGKRTISRHKGIIIRCSDITVPLHRQPLRNCAKRYIRVRRLSLAGVAGNGKCRPYAPYWDADIGNAYYHGAYGLQQCNRILGRRPSCVTGTASMTAEFVLSELQSVGSPEKAAHLSRFFKTEPGQYGEGDRFLGVVVPQTRSIAKANKAMPLDELQQSCRRTGPPLYCDRTQGIRYRAQCAACSI